MSKNHVTHHSEIELAAELEVGNGAILLRKSNQLARDGWVEASQELATSCCDALAWPEFANEDDTEWKW